MKENQWVLILMNQEIFLKDFNIAEWSNGSSADSYSEGLRVRIPSPQPSGNIPARFTQEKEGVRSER